jgi:hypothetical protein
MAVYKRGGVYWYEFVFEGPEALWLLPGRRRSAEAHQDTF